MNFILSIRHIGRFGLCFVAFLVTNILWCLSATATPLSTSSNPDETTAKQFVLVIDAGHGGHDSGAVGSVAKEKNINLNVALALGKLVQQNCPDVKIVYTRKTDVFIPLQERADIANRNKADLFISIHSNSVDKGRESVMGAETYTLGMHRAADNLAVAKRENSVITLEKDYKTTYQGFDPNKAESYVIFELMQDKYMAQSVQLAKAIQQQYQSAGRKVKSNGGVQQAGFLVLRQTSMPSILTELGFISNPTEEKYLNSEEGVATLAKCIFNGFKKYRKALAELNPEEGSRTECAEEAPLLAIATPSDPNKPSVRPVKTTPYPVATPVETPAAETAAETPAPQKKTEVGVKKQEAPAEKPVVKKQEAPAEKPVVKKQEAPAEKPVVKKQEAPAEKPVVKKQEAPAEKKAEAPVEKPAVADNKPVFKIQLFTSDNPVKAGDARFKGLEADYYKDNGIYKYTYGASNNYQEIVALKKSISEKFNGIFIVAFIDGKRTDLQQAIQQSKK